MAFQQTLNRATNRLYERYLQYFKSILLKTLKLSTDHLR